MGFGEGRLKDTFAFFKACRILYLRGENSLQKNTHFMSKKGPVKKRPLNWTGSVFPLKLIRMALLKAPKI